MAEALKSILLLVVGLALLYTVGQILPAIFIFVVGVVGAPGAVLLGSPDRYILRAKWHMALGFTLAFIPQLYLILVWSWYCVGMAISIDQNSNFPTWVLFVLAWLLCLSPSQIVFREPPSEAPAPINRASAIAAMYFPPFLFLLFALWRAAFWGAIPLMPWIVKTQ